MKSLVLTGVVDSSSREPFSQGKVWQSSESLQGAPRDHCMKEVRLGHGGDSKILDMPEHRDVYQEELHTGNAASPRQKYYVESNK